MKKCLVMVWALLGSIFFISSASSQDVVDPTSLNNKIMAGYQGWFGAPGDGSGYGWIHWSSGTPNPDNITFDMWPDLREYDEDELFPTDFYYSDFSNAGLFSSFTRKTVDRHVKWMKDYGIDGVFVQRFISSALSRQHQRDTVLQNVRWGAEKYGRVFANMYDMSGGKPASWVEDVKKDWMHLVDDIKITESPNYLHHDGLPVLSLWGVNVGGSKGDLTPAHWAELLQWFTVEAEEKYRVTLKAGVNNGWKDDSPDWQQVYDKFSFLSPWAVGRYKDISSANNYRNKYFQADLDETASRGMEYIPVVFPGFSWANLYEGRELNQIPRDGGKFLWHQFYNAIDAGCNMVYIAMFDEVDEGTAIFKTTETASQNPTTGKFVPLDMDGYDLPSDWYLRLSGEATKMIRGDIPLTDQIPIQPYPEDAEFVSQDVPTVMAPLATSTVSVTMTNTGTVSWTDSMKYVLGSISAPDSGVWGIEEVALDKDESIAPGGNKTFTFEITAPGAEGVYNFEWKIKREDSIWVGKPSKNRLVNVTSSATYLDDCDALTDWSSSGTLNLNNTDQKQGINCIEFSGGPGNVEDFYKVFSSPFNSGISSYDAILQFWYFISDASQVGNGIQVELGSDGGADSAVYSWVTKDLFSGWNLINLKVSEAGSITGSPDLNAINWFRITSSKSGNIISRIDEIQILDRYAGYPRYTLLTTNGEGGGMFAEGALVNISAGEAPPAQEFIGWAVDSMDVKIKDKYAENTTLIMPARDAEVSAQFKLFGIYLDDCDQDKNWKSSGTISMNTENQKEGLGCLEFNGSATDEYKKTFSTPYNSGASSDSGKLQFWYYVSDVTQFQSSNQVEIGSAGRNDKDEYNWNLSGLSNGWNFISLNIRDADIMGTPDLSAINWFRIYHFKNGNMTTRIDAIEIIDPAAGSRYPLTVYGGSGDGNYYTGMDVQITADPAPGEQVFDKWLVDSGSPVFTDVNAATTTLTTAAEGAVIRASYKDVEKFSLTVNNGSGSGVYIPGTQVVIRADPDAGDSVFVKWVVDSGMVDIYNINIGYTYLTMGEEDVIISASYMSDATVTVNTEVEKPYRVYPNPGSSVFNVDFKVTERSEVFISMHDISGREICSLIHGEILEEGNYSETLHLEGIQQGVYFLRFRMNNSQFSEMVVIR